MRGIYSNISCVITKQGEFKPLPHQLDTLEKFLNSPVRGMLLDHGLGSGKTCTAILIADHMIKKGLINHVYIMCTGSLRSTWINEYCKKCGSDSEILRQYYTFITYNYTVGERLPDFTGSLVIIDEVHILINSVKNFSKNATLIYDKLYDSKCRMLVLSATPIYNYIYEFAILGRLVNPGDTFPDIRTKDGLNTRAFMKYFDFDETTGQIIPKNPTIVKRMLDNIISYYPGSIEFNPKIIYMEPVRCIMSEQQELNYWQQFIKERYYSKLKPTSRLKMSDPEKYRIIERLYIMSKKNILSRSSSNFYYPPDVINKIDDLEVYGGWVVPENIEQGDLKILSRKFCALLINITLHIDEKHVVFTFFKQKSGAYMLQTLLELCGIKSKIFSGDLNDSERSRILKKFNSSDNLRGEKIKLLIVTEAGAQGISILAARHMHILESSPRINITIQAIGRVARFMSHMELPENERNIKVWKYWSVSSYSGPINVVVSVFNNEGEELKQQQRITDTRTIDEILDVEGMKNYNSFQSFLELLKQSSVTKIEK